MVKICYFNQNYKEIILPTAALIVGFGSVENMKNIEYHSSYP